MSFAAINFGMYSFLLCFTMSCILFPMFHLGWSTSHTPWGAVRRLPKLPGDRDDSWHYTYKPSGRWVKWGMAPHKSAIGGLVGGDWNMTCMFPYIGNNHSNWLIFFQMGGSTTNQRKFGRETPCSWEMASHASSFASSKWEVENDHAKKVIYPLIPERVGRIMGRTAWIMGRTASK